MNGTSSRLLSLLSLLQARRDWPGSLLAERLDVTPRPRRRAGGVAPPRRVEPHATVARDSRCYLAGWDLDQADRRTFRVDRMAPRTLTGPRFTLRAVQRGDLATLADRCGRAARDLGPVRTAES